MPTALRSLRQQSGLSLREVARRIGMEATQLSQIEQGKANATVQRLYDIAEAIGLEQLSDALAPFVRHGDEGS